MLNFLGIGSAFNTALGNTSAFIKKHNSILLFDCGSTVFNRLQKIDLLAGVNNLYIALTHTHPDHVGSLGELIFYSHYILNHKPKILFPDANLLNSLLALMGVDDSFYEVLSHMEVKITDEFLGYARLTFIPSSHVDKIPSYGIILEYEERTIYYSGDSNKISPLILEKFEKGQIDLIYQDTCNLDYKGNPHLFIGNLIECIKPCLRSRIYCMHLDQRFEQEIALQSGFSIAEIIAGL
ncbi:MAG: ribonuclease Z [Firmicutes bacterium ADurb.Bin419]|nr:MAG: ribonuclease Z [Firmicutes bacterium ADurb.Bin419]